MHAPAHICRALYKVAPELRLAWLGLSYKKRVSGVWETGNDDKGCFAIVQIESMRRVGTPDKPKVPQLMWPFHVDDPGPIFNRNGGTEPDWDMLSEVPLFIHTIDSDLGMDHSWVFGASSRIVAHIAQHRTDEATRRKRLRAELEAKGKNKLQQIDETVEAFTEGVQWFNSKHDSERYVIAKKHYKADQKKKRRVRKFSADHYVKQAGLDKLK
jgi:hypothetical protein